MNKKKTFITGTKSPPGVETLRASGDLLVRVPSKTFTAPPNRNNDDSQQGSSGHTSSGESITSGKRRRSCMCVNSDRTKDLTILRITATQHS